MAYVIDSVDILRYLDRLGPYKKHETLQNIASYLCGISYSLIHYHISNINDWKYINDVDYIVYAENTVSNFGFENIPDDLLETLNGVEIFKKCNKYLFAIMFDVSYTEIRKNINDNNIETLDISKLLNDLWFGLIYPLYTCYSDCDCNNCIEIVKDNWDHQDTAEIEELIEEIADEMNIEEMNIEEMNIEHITIEHINEHIQESNNYYKQFRNI